jgi:autotransporter-associated beta strand protein
VTIGGSHTLTVGTGGVTVESGSAAHAINAAVSLDSPQNWTNDSTSLLSIGGDIANGGNDLTVGGTGTIAISSVLGGGSGGVTKIGTGTLVLSAANTYSGDTLVNGGRLVVSNLSGSATGAGDVFVNSGAMLAGGGSISGLATINSGGVISPGNSPGTLTVGDVVWNGGGKYLWEMNNAAGTLGGNPGWDLLDVVNALGVSATPGNPFVILITSFGGNAANFDPSISASWQIAAASTLSGFNPLSFTLQLTSDITVAGSTGFTNSLAGGWFSIRLQEGAEPEGIYLQFNAVQQEIAVPEPATLALVGLALIASAIRRARRLNRES